MSSYSWVPQEWMLDAEQRTALTAISKSPKHVWIKGYAGSGKSVVLVHAAWEELNRRNGSRVCFVVFTCALQNLFSAGVSTENSKIEVFTIPGFHRDADFDDYDVVYIDEIQDMYRADVRKILRRTGRVVAAGDSAQSIYRDRLSPEGIEQVLSPASVKLSIIHRITRTIYDIAKHFGDIVVPKDSIELDVEVPLWHASSAQHELEFVWEQAHSVATSPESTAILLPERDRIIDFCNGVLEAHGKRPWTITRKHYPNGNRPYDWDSLNEHLWSNGVALEYLGSGAGDISNPKDGKVRIMTYHSAKGLDFKAVFLPMLTCNLQIWREEDLARTLFFVAVTRCRQNLHLSFSGPAQAHPFVVEVQEHLVARECPPSRGASGQDVSDDGAPLF